LRSLTLPARQHENRRRPACKPGSVPALAGGGRPFLSPAGCPAGPAAYPRVIAGRADPAPCLALLPVGFTLPARSPGPRCALTLRAEAPHHFTLTLVSGEW